MKYRIYLDSNSRKATHIVNDRSDAERKLPKDHGVIVKRFNGRWLADTFLVSWMGDHFKWDPCCCISDY